MYHSMRQPFQASSSRDIPLYSSGHPRHVAQLVNDPLPPQSPEEGCTDSTEYHGLLH
ncbi:hypothetical protein BJY04DRAFT_194869 [Aspergillus karnatakaensis]|uniref:uncharacterized protein n=1 Tax=Aspergillus karnatakaensis TaxID=1810916 RepID=UPI003CCD0A10